MAWCRECSEERPTQQQKYDGACPICKNGFVDHATASMEPVVWPHGKNCRGSSAGALDVCSFCHAPVFAAAQTPEEFSLLEEREKTMQRYLAKNTSGIRMGSPIAILAVALLLIVALLIFRSAFFDT